MMTSRNAVTLINPQNGNLALKLFSFENTSPFDHLQRLNYYSILLITHGQGRLTADFSDYSFGPNSLMSFGPYQPFMLTARDEIAGMALSFHSDFFCIYKHQKEVACSVLFNNVYQSPVIMLTEKETGHFLASLEQVRTEMQHDGLAQFELLVSHLKIFLITASRIKIDQNPQPNMSSPGVKEHFILQNLREAIEEHYKTKHSARDYAELLHISPNALAKISKNHFDKTLTQLISERLIIEAKRELYLTSKPVKTIAGELGFSDEYYFSRFFKTKTDISPQLFRESVGFARAEN